MTAKEQIAECIDRGSLIQIQLADQVITEMLGFALLVDQGLFWCRIYPEDQHHCHLTRFDGSLTVRGRELILPETKGRIVPFEFSHEVPPAQLKKEFKAWKAWLLENERTENFNRFVFRELQQHTG